MDHSDFSSELDIEAYTPKQPLIERVTLEQAKKYKDENQASVKFWEDVIRQKEAGRQ